MKIPDKMRYIKPPESSGTDVMRVVVGSVPVPSNTEVLIKVAAAGLSRGDIAQRKGLYPPPADASPILGLDVAGEVVSKGASVTQFNIGDKVCALTNGGGYAEFCAVPATQCLPWPKNYDAIHATALPENFFTVWANVFQKGYLQKHESILIHGGSGGIGLTAIQLAHEFAGKVYATAGSPEKCESCVYFGADAAINYHEENFPECILKFTQDKGVDVILDMVGAAYFQKNLDCLAVNGRLIIVATQGGGNVDHLDLRKLMFKRMMIAGSTMRARSIYEKGLIAADLREKVWPVLDQGICKPVIYKTFPLDEVNPAHQLMESSQHIGKIVLVMENLT